MAALSLKSARHLSPVFPSMYIQSFLLYSETL